ncbi:MAG: hypothetical protein JXL80_09615 [Planctomycetes bacterium]|nr:hypothetical protein [Planctomycetota bacterium]
MSGFETTVDCLMRSENRAARRVLGHALVHGSPVMCALVVDRLLTTTRGSRQSLLVEHFARLSDPLAQRVLGSMDRLGPAMRWAMASRKPQLQQSVVRLVDQAADLSMAYLVAEATGSADAVVRGEAVDLLCRWARNLRRTEMDLAGPIETTLNEESARRKQFILDALRRAFALRQAVETPRVLKAVAMLADDSAHWFWSAVSLRRDQRRQRLVAELTKQIEPELFGFVVRAMEHDDLATDAVALLQRPLSPAELRLLLREFGRRPQLSDVAVARLRQAPWLTAGQEGVEQLPAELLANLLSLAARSGMPSARLAVLCRTLAVEHAQDDARRMAVDALAHCGEAAAVELPLVAEQGPVATAVQAVVHMVRRGLFAAPSQQSVDRLLSHWWRLEATDRREVGRAMRPVLAEQPRLLDPHLENASPTREAALNVIRLASAADAFAERLQQLADDPSDVRVQSAAVALVGDSASEGTAAALRAALGSRDARVRANALEALDRRHADADVFLPFVRDGNSRVRANAAMALLGRDRPEGRQVLRDMLASGEADRISALWVFSQVRPQGFARTAELLTRRDPSDRVRLKAAQLLASA